MALSAIRVPSYRVGQSWRGRRVGQADSSRLAKSGRRDSFRACSVNAFEFFEAAMVF